MPKNQTIYDRETGEPHTITAISAEEACKKHPEKWSRVPVPAAASPAKGKNVEPPPPPVLDPDEDADDLQAIDGIGASREEKLNAAGIYTYAQLAAVADPPPPPLDQVGSNAEWKRWREQAGRLASTID